MATIRSFEKRPTSIPRRHPTDVDCGWQVVHLESGKVLQLDTYGSDERKLAGKVSQSLQLDERRADELLNIIREVFPSLPR